VFTTSAGEYWLTLFDSFGATGLTFIAFTGIPQMWRRGNFLSFLSVYVIQHCFICRPSDYTVSEDAGI
jgi:hypothetical protein